MASGTPAPDFCVKGLSGDREVRLRDYRGRPLVLVFGTFG
jgi:peroxiredoxin